MDLGTGPVNIVVCHVFFFHLYHIRHVKLEVLQFVSWILSLRLYYSVSKAFVFLALSHITNNIIELYHLVRLLLVFTLHLNRTKLTTHRRIELFQMYRDLRYYCPNFQQIYWNLRCSCQKDYQIYIYLR